MAEIRKVLGQAALPATILTDVYTVPALTQAVVSSVTVCNRSATPTTFRMSVAIGGAADTTSQYIYYDVQIPGNETLIATVGITLGAGDKIRGFAGANTLSMALYGVEIA